MIIDHGHLLFDGDLHTLKTRFGGQRELIVEFAETYENVQVEGAELLSQTGLQVRYGFYRTEITASELIGRVSAAFRIRDLEVREPDIETTVRRIYEERLLEKP